MKQERVDNVRPTTKQVSGLKIFFDIKRWAIVVVSIDDEDAVFELLMVVEDDDRVSSVSKSTHIDV